MLRLTGTETGVRAIARAMVLLLASAAGAAARCPDYSRLKNVYFGDLHTHTAYSLDAYTFGTRTDPAAALAFATGSAVDVGLGFDVSSGEVPGPLGVTIAPSGGALDFNAVTDHSEWLADAYGCTVDPASPFHASPWCTALRANDDTPEGPRPCRGFTDNGATGCLEVQSMAWAAEQQATEAANAPCTFTAFHGYEWTLFLPALQTLHQNVIFATASVPAVPVDANNYRTAPLLWAALAEQCHAGIGCEALTIPHNMNLSNGLAFDTTGYTPTDLNRLLKYRKLVELHQHKGNSECLTDSADGGAVTACDFEVQPPLALPQDTPGYARPALEAGLARFAAQGYNPGRFGFVGATDNHNATPGRVDETSYTGHIGARDNRLIQRIGGARRTQFNNPGGITGVWAEENTREALFAALKRRETFATSGPRIRVRFYQNVGAASPCTDPSFPQQIVDAGGVPMGGTLHDTGAAPTFVVHALQDQTPLASIDIVKASVVAGAAEEKIRTIPLGATPHCITWTDPDFVATEPAFWYARVKEQPVWRWSHYDCETLRGTNPAAWQTIAPGCLPGGGLDVMVQERAWTSSIWHLPGGPVTIQSTMKLRDGSALGDPSRRRFSFKSSTRKDASVNRIVAPAPGSAGDPTIGGGTLTIYNPETEERYTTTLAASGWSRVTANRYRFDGGSGPIQRVLVRRDRLSIKARGSAFGYTLDEPRQGTVAVRLQLGTAPPWCAEAPAHATGNPPTTARYDTVDAFTGAKRAPAPDQCPLLAGSPSGAFVE